jgi:hypothetical protein
VTADGRMLGANEDDHLLDNAVILTKRSMKVPVKSWNGNQKFSRVLKWPGVQLNHEMHEVLDSF